MVSFCQISSLSFPIKTYFLEQEHLVFKRFEILSLHKIGTNEFSYLGRGAQSNFSMRAVRRFPFKDNIYALQPRLYFSSPNLFSLFLLYDIYCIVDLCGVNQIISLLLFCYLIQDYASSSYLFLSFYFNLFPTIIERKVISLSSCIVFSAVAFYLINMFIMNMILSFSD